jgi:hypothetical protein
MVKKNPNNNSLHSKNLVLEEKDKDAIKKAMEDTPVDINEMKISNPTNDLEGLYILIASTTRSDLFEDETISSLRYAAKKVGYNGSQMDRGNFPSRKEPKRYDQYNQEYYTLSIWFKHRG